VHYDPQITPFVSERSRETASGDTVVESLRELPLVVSFVGTNAFKSRGGLRQAQDLTVMSKKSINHRSNVPMRRIFRCNCITPLEQSSARRRGIRARKYPPARSGHARTTE